MKKRKTLRIAVLLSGNGSNLKAILAAIKNGKLKNAEVVCVGSDDPRAYGLKRAEEAGIQTFTLDYKKALSDIKNKEKPKDPPKDYRRPSSIVDDENAEKSAARALIEAQLLELMKNCKVDLLVCAGFMKILTPYFLNRFQPNPLKPCILNIHPALLPAFPGTDGYGDAWKNGVRIYGPTVHFMDDGVDTGPIIGQTGLRRKETDNFDSFKERGLRAEWKLYPRCIDLFVKGRLTIEPGPDGQRKVVRILPLRTRSRH